MLFLFVMFVLFYLLRVPCGQIPFSFLVIGDLVLRQSRSVLILILADLYNLCLCRFGGKQYTLFQAFLLNLSEMRVSLHEIFWMKVKPD